MNHSHCPRCKGLMIEEAVIEDGMKIYMKRCPLCGFYTDETAELNRRLANTQNNGRV